MQAGVAFKENAEEMTRQPYMTALSPTSVREANEISADVPSPAATSLKSSFMTAAEVATASDPNTPANIITATPAISPAETAASAATVGASLTDTAQKGIQYTPPQSDLGAATGAVYNTAAELGGRIMDFFADKSPEPEIEPPQVANRNAAPTFGL